VPAAPFGGDEGEVGSEGGTKEGLHSGQELPWRGAGAESLQLADSGSGTFVWLSEGEVLPPRSPGPHGVCVCVCVCVSV